MKRDVPYHTGKVQIGLLYQPKPPVPTEHAETVQQALIGRGTPLSSSRNKRMRLPTLIGIAGALYLAAALFKHVLR